MKSVCKPHLRINEFGECHKCLLGGAYQQECDNYVIRVSKHQMYLLKICKSTISPFDQKGCCLNEIGSSP